MNTPYFTKTISPSRQWLMKFFIGIILFRVLYYNISQLKTFRILQEVRGENQRTEEATSLEQGTEKLEGNQKSRETWL